MIPRQKKKHLFFFLREGLEHPVKLDSQEELESLDHGYILQRGDLEVHA